MVEVGFIDVCVPLAEFAVRPPGLGVIFQHYDAVNSKATVPLTVQPMPINMLPISFTNYFYDFILSIFDALAVPPFRHKTPSLNASP